VIFATCKIQDKSVEEVKKVGMITDALKNESSCYYSYLEILI